MSMSPELLKGNVGAALNEHVGTAGRMLHAGKVAKPGHTVYWNACGFTKNGRQVWFGDLDLTAESGKVQAAADAAQETIVITPEQPFRFDGLKRAAKRDRDKDKSDLYFHRMTFKCPGCQYEHTVTFSIGQVLVALDGAVWVDEDAA